MVKIHYSDYRENYPLIWECMKAGYFEDKVTDWNNPRPRSKYYFRHRKRRVGQKSARKSAASKKRHFLERQIRYDEIPEFPMRNKPLVLYFYGNENFGYVATTNAGYFVVDYVEYKNQDLNYAECAFKRFDGTFVMKCRAKTISGAIAALCAKKWAIYKTWNKHYSLYAFYKAIHFWFEDKPRTHKQPRNNTRTIKMPKTYHKLF